MICVEGYKAFRGTMRITPKCAEVKAFCLTDDWLYRPDTGCWYCQGRNFAGEICDVLDDKADATVEQDGRSIQ